MIGLYRHNTATGYWDLQRTCAPDTAQDWLAIFSKDQPKARFALSVRKPKACANAFGECSI